MALRILLIGGPSGTGKSVAAQEIARSIGWSVIQVDDIRLAVQAVTDERQQSALHPFTTAHGRWPTTAEEYSTALWTLAEELEPALRIVMAHHLAEGSAGPLMIEGDGFLPRLGSAGYLGECPEFQAVSIEDSIRAVFLVANDPDFIRQRVLTRGRGIESQSANALRLHVDGSHRFGQELAEMAQAFDLPVLRSSPLDTLVARIRAAVDI